MVCPRINAADPFGHVRCITIRQGEPGDCLICGMDLIPLETDSQGPMAISMSPTAMRISQGANGFGSEQAEKIFTSW
jgi:hypothetical protein